MVIYVYIYLSFLFCLSVFQTHSVSLSNYSKNQISGLTFTKISDCRRVVMWGNIICYACWCISFWGSWWTQGLPKNNTSISLGLIIASWICDMNLIWKCPLLFHAENSQCSVFHSKLCSNIYRVSPPDLKDICCWPWSG